MLHTRLKSTPVVANDVLKVVSIIVSWAKKNGKFDGGNPCLSVVKYPEKKIKMRMSNEDVEKSCSIVKAKLLIMTPSSTLLLLWLCYLENE